MGAFATSPVDSWRESTGHAGTSPRPASELLDQEIADQVEASLHEGVLVVGPSGEIIFASDAACRLLRLSREQLSGRASLGPDWGAIHVDGSPIRPDERPALRAIATGEPISGFVTGVRDGDDQEAWFEISARPLDWRGETIAISVISDITNRIIQRRQFDVAMGEMMQALVQPDLPSSGKVYFATRYRSAGATRLVGGDCHGAHQLGPDRYAFFICDVCGHGVEVAGLSVLARHTMRTAARLLDDPSAVLRHLHDVVAAERPDTYLTAIFGYVDVGDSITVRFSSGGHPMPLLIADGQVTAVGSPGPILGMVPNQDRPVTTLEVEDGQHLLLYTDGLTSTRQREIEGSELLASLPAHLLTDVLADVALGLADQPDRDPDDDATVLAIGFHSPAPVRRAPTRGDPADVERVVRPFSPPSAR